MSSNATIVSVRVLSANVSDAELCPCGNFRSCSAWAADEGIEHDDLR